MFDIQCSKLTFDGSMLRILEKIHQTVQCVKNGKLEGNLHIKANVVEDLKSTFDTHSIAGTKLAKLLCTEVDRSRDEEKPPTSPPASRPGKLPSRTPSSGSSRPSPPSSTTSTPSRFSSPSCIYIDSQTDPTWHSSDSVLQSHHERATLSPLHRTTERVPL